jgi:hypothetical protein
MNRLVLCLAALASLTLLAGCPEPEPEPEDGPAQSCADVLADNDAATSGLYELDLDGDGAVEDNLLWCDMDTDGGGWTRWWWYEADASDWSSDIDTLGAALADCGEDDAMCFALIPDADAASLMVWDGVDFATWDFEDGNATSDAAWAAFYDHEGADYAYDFDGEAWNPVRNSDVGDTLDGAFSCSAPDPGAESAGDCKNFWYDASIDGAGAKSATLGSFQLDDDGNPGRTAFGAGYDAWGEAGCDVLDNTTVPARNEPGTALTMYFR